LVSHCAIVESEGLLRNPRRLQRDRWPSSLVIVRSHWAKERICSSCTPSPSFSGIESRICGTPSILRSLANPFQSRSL